MADQLPNGVQVSTWEKFKYAMDRWGLPVVALIVIAILFWRNMNSQDEFAKQTLFNQGQLVQLTIAMHQDHEKIINVQATAAEAQEKSNELQMTTNELLVKINNEQHGKDR